MLFLHGLGECGDNELERVKIQARRNWLSRSPIFRSSW